HTVFAVERLSQQLISNLTNCRMGQHWLRARSRETAGAGQWRNDFSWRRRAGHERPATVSAETISFRIGAITLRTKQSHFEAPFFGKAIRLQTAQPIGVP